MTNDSPSDPLTGRRSEGTPPDAPVAGPDGGTPVDAQAASVAAQRMAAGSEPPQPKRGRPPLWLIAMTLAIPIVIFGVWFSNWQGRNLDGPQILSALASDDLSAQGHALHQFTMRVADWRFLKSTDPEKERRGTEVEGLADAILSFAERASSKMQVQERVANALGVIGELPFHDVRTRAKSRLESMHLDATSPIVRFQAACALAKFGDGSPAVVQTLRLALEEMDAQQRLNAVYALGMVGDRNVADDLSRVANSDSNAEVRHAARRAHEFAAAR